MQLCPLPVVGVSRGANLMGGPRRPQPEDGLSAHSEGPFGRLDSEDPVADSGNPGSWAARRVFQRLGGRRGS